MSEEKPGWYGHLRARHPSVFRALETLGEAVRSDGPLDDKTAHLIQLAAAAAIHSEGAVHSHARRALEAGATDEELFHAVLLTTSTIGFPTVSAALSWIDDILSQEHDFHMLGE